MLQHDNTDPPTIYVIKCGRDDTYYVGLTRRDVDIRFDEHRSGKGAAYTRGRGPLTLIMSREGDVFDEDKTVKQFMSVHGIGRVYGGSYANEPHSEEQVRMLTAELRMANDQCLCCGNRGHFLKDCPTRFSQLTSQQKLPKHMNRCFNCGGTGHQTTTCPEARVIVYHADGTGQIYPGDRVCYYCRSPDHISSVCPTTPNSCYRCHQPGHIAAQCPTGAAAAPSVGDPRQPDGGSTSSTPAIKNFYKIQPWGAESSQATVAPSPAENATLQSPVLVATLHAQSRNGCHHCGQSGHYVFACPLKHGGPELRSPIRCNNCKELGHVATRCPRGVSCYKCGRGGHISPDCPATVPQSVAAVPPAITCLRCGREGHKSYNCSHKMHRGGWPINPK